MLVVQSNVYYHCTVPTDSMGRKFRLTRKKRYYCVTVPSLTVSIPLDVIHVCPVPSPRQSSLCISWSRELFESSPVDSVHSLHSRISRAEVIPVGKAYASNEQLLSLVLHLGWDCIRKSDKFVYYNFASESTVPTVNFSLHVESSLSWQVFYRSVEVSKDKCPLLSPVPHLLSCVSAAKHLFNTLLLSKACIGNSDERFLSLINTKGGIIHDHTGKLSKVNSNLNKVFCTCVGKSVAATVESHLLSTPTIRHAKCELLCNTSSERCAGCTSYRDTLRATASKRAKATTTHSHPSSSANYRFLSKDELTDRLRATHNLQRNTFKKLERLKAKVVESIETSGVDVDEDTHSDLLKVRDSQNLLPKYCAPNLTNYNMNCTPSKLSIDLYIKTLIIMLKL